MKYAFCIFTLDIYNNLLYSVVQQEIYNMFFCSRDLNSLWKNDI